jgi:hypothetical protein
MLKIVYLFLIYLGCLIVTFGLFFGAYIFDSGHKRIILNTYIILPFLGVFISAISLYYYQRLAQTKNASNLIDAIAYTVVSIICLFYCMISFSYLNPIFVISSAAAFIMALIDPYKLANYKFSRYTFPINLIASIAFGILLSSSIGINLYLAKMAFKF